MYVILCAVFPLRLCCGGGSRSRSPKEAPDDGTEDNSQERGSCEKCNCIKGRSTKKRENFLFGSGENGTQNHVHGVLLQTIGERIRVVSPNGGQQFFVLRKDMVQIVSQEKT